MTVTVDTVTNIKEVIGKNMKMEVAQDVELHIEVINDKEVKYQFVGLDDGTKDPEFTTKLEIKYDDIFGETDYSFTDLLGGRFFLFQFEEVDESNV